MAYTIPEKAVSKIYDSIEKVLTTAIHKIVDANDDVLKGELKDFMDIHKSGLKVTAKPV